ncbi:MAG TPA: hypothetical protein PKV44_05950, partial [Bacillota bacterium]|nr:hypothetical protein [Bacillota bacterium]
ALVAGLILSVPSPSVLRKILAFVLAEAIMVGGYLAFESFLYGFAPACGSLIPNALQGITAIIIGMILSFALRKRRDKKLTGGTRNG